MAFRVVARIKAPPGYVGRWLNIYLQPQAHIQAGGLYRTRRQADDIAKSWRHDCVWTLIPGLIEHTRKRMRRW